MLRFELSGECRLHIYSVPTLKMAISYSLGLLRSKTSKLNCVLSRLAIDEKFGIFCWIPHASSADVVKGALEAYVFGDLGPEWCLLITTGGN